MRKIQGALVMIGAPGITEARLLLRRMKNLFAWWRHCWRGSGASPAGHYMKHLQPRLCELALKRPQELLQRLNPYVSLQAQTTTIQVVVSSKSLTWTSCFGMIVPRLRNLWPPAGKPLGPDEVDVPGLHHMYRFRDLKLESPIDEGPPIGVVFWRMYVGVRFRLCRF